MRLSTTSLEKMEAITAELKSNRRIVLQNKDGLDVAAIVPIEDLYLLQKLDDCLNVMKPTSHFPEYVKEHVMTTL